MQNRLRESRRAPARLVYGAYRRPAIGGEPAVLRGESVPSSRALQEAPPRDVRRVFPVIELRNCELRRRGGPEAELAASNALRAGLVRPEGCASAREAEGRAVGVWINGEPQGPARAAPTATLGVLAERLAAHGIALAAGDSLRTGSPLPLFPAAPGDSIRVRWGGSAVGEATLEPWRAHRTVRCAGKPDRPRSRPLPAAGAQGRTALPAKAGGSSAVRSVDGITPARAEVLPRKPLREVGSCRFAGVAHSVAGRLGGEGGPGTGRPPLQFRQQVVLHALDSGSAS